MKRNESISDQRVVEILTEAFADNQSINYVVKQDRQRPWYQRFGSEVYDELNFSYPLYLLRSTTESSQ